MRSFAIRRLHHAISSDRKFVEPIFCCCRISRERCLAIQCAIDSLYRSSVSNFFLYKLGELNGYEWIYETDNVNGSAVHIRVWMRDCWCYFVTTNNWGERMLLLVSSAAYLKCPDKSLFSLLMDLKATNNKTKTIYRQSFYFYKRKNYWFGRRRFQELCVGGMKVPWAHEFCLWGEKLTITVDCWLRSSNTDIPIDDCA